MKKILFITDIMHSAPRIPGVIKYIPRYGYEPILLSPTTESEIRYFGWYPILPSGLKKCFRPAYHLYQSIVHYPDEMRGSFKKLWKPAEEILQQEKIAAIISSSSPVSAHILASHLKKKYSVPWIADLRDLWSQNHDYPFGPIRRWRDTRLEYRILKYANALITVSEPLAEKLRQRYPQIPVKTITNGFDPDTRIQVPLIKKFSITYTGQIYPGKQDLTLFKRPYDELLSSGILPSKDTEFRLFGPQGTIIPRKEAIIKQRESQILLLLNWRDNEGVYTLKVFEYLAAGRPILSVGGTGGDVIEDLLKTTNAGMYASTEEEAKNYLIQSYREYVNTGSVRYHGIPEKIEMYSFIEIAHQFAEVLDNMESKLTFNPK